MTHDQARARFAESPVARLATCGADGQPHLVPLVFALSGDVLYSAVDAKPKTTTALRRLANVVENPRVALLVDRYDADWTQLWWVRADGRARVAGLADVPEALDLLVARYPVYRSQPPPGPVLVVDVVRWTGWAAS